jgi:ArsR family transcriptional regulator
VDYINRFKSAAKQKETIKKLADGEKCVCEFVDAIDADFSTISKHLSVLKQAGIVMDDKRGKQVFYTLKVPCVINFMGCVEAVIKSQADDQAALVKCSL